MSSSPLDSFIRISNFLEQLGGAVMTIDEHVKEAKEILTDVKLMLGAQGGIDVDGIKTKIDEAIKTLGEIKYR